MSDIVVTIPQHFQRIDVMRQLQRCTRRPWHYVTNRLPRELPGQMHFVHKGEVIGSLPVVAMGTFHAGTLTRPDGSPMFTCRHFAIRAAGEFTGHSPPLRMKGFQGWRYFDDRCPECGGLGIINPDTRGEKACPACALTEAAR